MGPFEAVRSCLAKYATFSGRARRSEYWWFAVLSFAASAVLAAIAQGREGAWIAVPVICSLALVVPGLAVQIRRLHDTGRSGLWWFIGFVPIVGAVVLLVLSLLDSQPGANDWGISPKYPQGTSSSTAGTTQYPRATWGRRGVHQ